MLCDEDILQLLDDGNVSEIGSQHVELFPFDEFKSLLDDYGNNDLDFTFNWITNWDHLL